jgi:hypothetical protein
LEKKKAGFIRDQTTGDTDDASRHRAHKWHCHVHARRELPLPLDFLEAEIVQLALEAGESRVPEILWKNFCRKLRRIHHQNPS